MEKRSRRRIRDLVALPAFQGLSQNEIGCARISMMARSTNAPFKGRIQKRKTNHLQIITFGLQRTAGPYKRAKPKTRYGVKKWPPAVSLFSAMIRKVCLLDRQSRHPRASIYRRYVPPGLARLPPLGAGVY
jgi:hypothetical protein